MQIDFTFEELFALANRTSYTYNSLTALAQRVVNDGPDADAWYSAQNKIALHAQVAAGAKIKEVFDRTRWLDG